MSFSIYLLKNHDTKSSKLWYVMLQGKIVEKGIFYEVSKVTKFDDFT